jgi:hypothetical protein
VVVPDLAQEDKDFAFWGVDFQAYAQRAQQLGMFLDRRPVRVLTMHAGCLHPVAARIGPICAILLHACQAQGIQPAAELRSPACRSAGGNACAVHILSMRARVRPQIVDFDGQSLRRCLPRIVKTLQGALSAGGRVYVHCTAGLGRAPAVCIAWRYWYGGLQLDEVRGGPPAVTDH